MDWQIVADRIDAGVRLGEQVAKDLIRGVDRTALSIRSGRGTILLSEWTTSNSGSRTVHIWCRTIIPSSLADDPKARTDQIAR
jgi:hypothetical protein